VYDGATASAAAGHIDSATIGTAMRLVCNGNGGWVSLVNGTRTVT